MAALSKDPYKVLGVTRSATLEQVKKAFRRKAKQFHPDRNPDRAGEEKFREINSAYEILGDATKRARYDAGRARARSGGKGGSRKESSRAGRKAGELFGFMRGFRGSGASQAGPSAASKPASKAGSPTSRKSASKSEHEPELTVTLEEAYRGTSRKVELLVREHQALGRIKTARRSFEVKIPAGIHDGQRIRLKGDKSRQSGQHDDVVLRIRISPHAVFSFQEDDLVAELKISPWEAALGTKLRVPTLDGSAEIKVPAGVDSGKKLRLRNQGFPLQGKTARGDLLYRVSIVVPKNLTKEEESLMKRLQGISRFNPRLDIEGRQ